MVKIVENFKTQQVNLQQQNDENDDTLAAPACISIMTVTTGTKTSMATGKFKRRHLCASSLVLGLLCLYLWLLCLWVSTVPMTAVLATTVTAQYRKLSRLEEQVCLEEEILLVKETKVTWLLDILEELYKYCIHPGCANKASFKQHTIGPT